MAFGALGIAPTSVGAQSAGAVTHTGMTGQCGIGSLRLAGTEIQEVEAGSVVVVTDTVHEGDAVRELSSTDAIVPVPLSTTVSIDHPLFWRSATGDADYTYVRRTEVFSGSPAPAALLATETITVVCAGSGAASITVSEGSDPESTTTTSTSSGTGSPSPYESGGGQVARPIVIAPRFTG